MNLHVDPATLTLMLTVLVLIVTIALKVAIKFTRIHSRLDALEAGKHRVRISDEDDAQ